MIGAFYLKLWTYIDVVTVHWRCLDVLGSTSQLITESSSFDLKWMKLRPNGSTASTSWQVGKSIRLRPVSTFTLSFHLKSRWQHSCCFDCGHFVMYPLEFTSRSEELFNFWTKSNSKISLNIYRFSWYLFGTGRWYSILQADTVVRHDGRY